MKKFGCILLIVSVLVLFFSCEKIFFDETIENTPTKNYDYLWNQVKDKYAFFALKDVDWDLIYDKYKPNDNATDEELFSQMAKMLNELKDGHVNLISPFNVSRYDITLLGPVNINTRLVKEEYLKDDYYSTGPFRHNFIRDGEIAYVRYSAFDGSIIDNNQLEYIVERYKNTKGMILDIRQNGGGYIVNVFNLLSIFTHSSRELYETQIKTGSGETDFSTLEKVIFEPSDIKKYSGKLAVLTDRGSYSASSFFAVATYAYDNIFLVGDTTGGGLGLPNGGQLPNGWTYRFSITQTIAVDGNNYENGVPPNHTVILSKEDEANGIDNVIEFAADILLQNI